MGTSSSSAQLDSSEGDEEQNTGQNKVTEHDTDEEELQSNGQISRLSQECNNQDVELNGQCEEKVPGDDENKCVKRRKYASDINRIPLESPQNQDVFHESSEDFNNDGATENEVNSEGNDSEFGFKKIFKFGEFKLTLRKDRTDADELTTNELHKKVPRVIGNSTISVEASSHETNNQMVEEMQNDPIRGDSKNQVKAQEMLISDHSEKKSSVKGLIEDVSQNPDPEVVMSPVKRFFTPGIWSNLRKSKKDEEVTLKGNNQDEAQAGSLQEDSTCKCLDISHITCEEGKDLQITERDDSKLLAEKEPFYYLEQDTVQSSPFKRLLRKISRRHKETMPVETEPKESGENLTENRQLRTDTIQFQDTNEKTNVTEQKNGVEELNTSHEEKKRPDSIISWEALKCGGSFKKRSRKSSDSEDETQDKEDKPKTTAESPLESSTEGDYNHLTSSNEHTGSSAEDEGSTWKTLKKLVTPKRKSRMEESGSTEQILSDTDIITDESSCSLKKLILGHKKVKADVQKVITSSESLCKDTETDNKEDETPVIVPLSEYDIVEPDSLQVMVKKTLKIPVAIEKEIHFITEEDKPSETKLLVKPLYSSGPSIVPIFSDNNDDLTEFISNYQQLSDIPEEGIIEESLATPASFTEWMTQDDTLAEELVDMTADAVTARDHASEDLNGDDTSEMVSAVSQLTESPRTSGNVTPVSHACYISEADLILQETVETICVSPSALSFAINEKVSEALPMSVSPCIIDSVPRTETKVFVIHNKKEATSICTGLDCTEICAVEKVLPMSFLEGLLEISEAVPVDLVSEHLAENSQIPDMATDEVFEAESNELEIKFDKAFSVKQNATVKTSGQKIQTQDSIQDEVTCVIEMEDVLGKTQLLREQVVAEDMNRSHNQGCDEIVLLPTAHEKAEHSHVEDKESHNFLDFGSAATAQDVGASVPDVSLNKAFEITEDNAQVAIGEDITLVAHNGEAPLPSSTLNEASEMTKDVKLTSSENVEILDNNVVASVSETTFNQVTEYQVALADYVELVIQDVLASVPDILIEESKSTKNNVQELQAVDVKLVEHNSAAAGTESTLNEESVIKDNIVQFILAEHTELLGDNDIASVSSSSLNYTKPEESQRNNVIIVVPVLPDSTSDMAEDVQVTLTEHDELLAQNAAELEDINAFKKASQIAVDVVQIPQVEYTLSVTHNEEKSVQTIDVPSMLIEPAHSAVVSVADSTFNEAIGIAEEFVQVFQTEIVCCDVSEPGSILNEASVIKDVGQIHQVENTGAAIQSEEVMLDSTSSDMADNGEITQSEAVNTIELNMMSLEPDSIVNCVEAVEIENKVEMDITHSLDFVDCLEIQDIEVNELKTAKANAEAVPGMFKDNTIQQEETTENNEDIATDTYNNKQLSSSAEESTEVALHQEKQDQETNMVCISVEDHKATQSTSIPTKNNKEQNHEETAFSDGPQLAVTFSNLNLKIHSTDVATQSAKFIKTESAESEDVKGPCVDDESSIYTLEYTLKHTMEAKAEIGSEIATEPQELLQALETEPQKDTKQQPVDSQAMAETFTEKGTQVTTVGAKVTESSLDIPETEKETSQASVTEICLKESSDKLLGLESSVFTSIINELHINTVVHEPLDKPNAVVPATPMISVHQVHQINEAKHNIPDEDINASNRNNEKLSVASSTQLVTPTVAPVIQTAIIALTDEMPLKVQQQMVVPTVQTLGVNIAVNEAEITFAEPEIKKEPDKENIKITQSYMMEQLVNFTEATEYLIRIEESTSVNKKDTDDIQSTSGAKQHFISTVNTAESLVEDLDVWEDAVDISDDEC